MFMRNEEMRKQNCKHFLEYFGFYLLTNVFPKTQYQEFLFISRVTTRKENFYFSQVVQSRHNTSNLRTNHFCIKCYVELFFNSNIPLIEKILWKNYVGFWVCNLKCTPLSTQNLFLRKSNLKFCIIFNMISFANTQSSVKIRLACSKVLLLIVSSETLK